MAAPSASLASLAAVELQLCLQPLDNRSRVMTARCCRTLLKAASHPFAWRHAETVTVSQPVSAELVTRLNSSTSLLRFVAILYRAPESSGEELGHVASLTGLTGLDLRGLQPSAAFVSDHTVSLLQRAEVQSRLQLLAMPRQTVPGAAEIVSRMPLLRALAASIYDVTPAPREFACARTLTKLALSMEFVTDGAPPLSCFTSLHTLRLTSAIWTDAGLARMFSSAPALCATLQRLSLDFVFLRNVHETATMPQTTAAFACLTALHTLELRQVSRVAALLPAVTRAPALRSLLIQIKNASPWASANSRLTADGVRAMLDASPQLQLRIMCGYDAASSARAVHASDDSSNELSTLQSIARLPRVQMVAAEPPPDVLQ